MVYASAPSSAPELFEQAPAAKGVQSTFSPAHLKTVVSVKRRNLRVALQSGSNFHKYIQTPGSDLGPSGSAVWINDDLLPTPPAKRTWRWYNYFVFYFALSMDNWTLGSTFIGIGLNWWQAIIIVVVSQVISSIAMALNSRNGESYHVGYPIVARSVFGHYGAYYVVGARAILAIFWYAVKLYTGSSFVVVMMTCVFGHHFTDIPNHVPLSVGFTTQQFLCFFLYWLIHVPFTFLRPFQLRWLFTFKMCTVVPAMFGLFIFCMAHTKGHIGTIVAPKTATSGSSLAWFFVLSINAGLGNTANLITNQPDFSRWAYKRHASTYPQLVANPISVTLAATLGILSTSAINNAWGLALWNPWDLLLEIVTRYDRPDVKFAIFLCAAFWAILVLGTNIAANSIPFGADSSLLLPKYINMTRGQFIVLVLAWVTCPWKILSSAGTFVAFLGGYGLFMAAVVGVMTADYYLITRGNMFIRHLYDGDPRNPHYHYFHGFNIQAFIAYIAGIALPFAGFVGSLGASVSTTALDMGHLGWLLSYVTSIVVYVALCKIWPNQNQQAIKRMPKLRFEQMAQEQSELLDGLIPIADGVHSPEDIRFGKVEIVDEVNEKVKGY